MSTATTTRRNDFQERHPFGPAVANLIDRFADLPGIGRKSAERLANYILSCSKGDAMALADAIAEVKHSVRPCRVCFNLAQTGENGDGRCEICRDPRREQESVCIVEQPRDVTILEASGAWGGLYHVLQGRLAPLENVGPEDLTLAALVKRIRENGIHEVVMATNPTTEGDGTALYITNLLEHDDVRVTRLARGIASGSVLEFANKEMLADALHNRQSM